MSDDRGPRGGTTPDEEALERTLARVGPLLRRRAEAEAPDPAFVAALRARLAPDEAAVASPLVLPDVAPPRPRPRLLVGGRRGVGAGLAAAALVAVVLIALLVVVWTPRPAHAPTVAWRPPLPSLADLTRGFPAPAVAHAAGALSPTVSLAAPPHGVAYAGHVSLSTAPLPVRAVRLHAFRLMAPTTSAAPARVARLARALGIHATVRRTSRGGAAWAVAAEGGAPSRQPLHSVAVAGTTGELVYHDASYLRTPRRERWRDNPFAVAAARAWLTRLGWPGARMTVAPVEHSGIPAGLREIEFGWAGVSAAATDAATLWVTPGGRVVEADVWPPVESVRSLPARDVAAAWTAVRGGLVPLAVAGVPPNTAAPGTGRMRGVTITYVLSTGTDHRLYLVPTYHFAGTARLRGIHGERICYALAPAGRGNPAT